MYLLEFISEIKSGHAVYSDSDSVFCVGSIVSIGMCVSERESSKSKVRATVAGTAQTHSIGHRTPPDVQSSTSSPTVYVAADGELSADSAGLVPARCSASRGLSGGVESFERQTKVKCQTCWRLLLTVRPQQPRRSPATASVRDSACAQSAKPKSFKRGAEPEDARRTAAGAAPAPPTKLEVL